VQIFVDDPAFTLWGPRKQRRRGLVAVLLLWSAIGFRVQWEDGEIGETVDWIGAQFKSSPQRVSVIVHEKFVKETLEEADAILASPMVPLKRLRRLTGKVTWAAGLTRKGRWVTNRLWSVITEATRVREQVQSGARAGVKQRGRGGPRHSLIHTRRVAPPLK
jgi:hypothetical protein